MAQRPAAAGSSDRDRLDDRQAAGGPRGGAGLVAQPHGLRQAGRGEDVFGLASSLPSSSTMRSARPSLTTDLRHAAAQPQLAAQVAELAAPAASGSAARPPAAGPALQEDRAEQDAELAEVHVVLPRAAVEQHRTEQHLDQQRIVDQAADDLAGRAAGLGPVELVVVGQRRQQPPEVVRLAGKMPRDLRLQQLRSRWRTPASRRET